MRDPRQFVAHIAGTPYASADNAITLNVPQLVAATHDGTTLRTYVNAVEVGSWVCAGPTTTADGAWNLGTYIGTGKATPWGTLHEMGFDNTCFSQAKLLAMKAAAGV